jgi:DNA-binding MarR family transcriptional regulator
MNDPIDRIIAQWQQERPDLDPTPMGTVGRILRLSTHLRERVEAALKPFELSLWQFDVLATLRRNGPPFRMSPKELMTDVMLSSGAMTNRLDRLEASGYIVRLPDPNDRRGVQIELTEQGRALVDQAIAARFSEATEVAAILDTKERTELEAALRKLLTALEAGERESK